MLPSCIPRRARQAKTPATLNFTAGVPCGQRQELQTKVKGGTHYLTSEHINPAVKGWAEERQRLAKNDRGLATTKFGPAPLTEAYGFCLPFDLLTRSYSLEHESAIANDPKLSGRPISADWQLRGRHTDILPCYQPDTTDPQGLIELSRSSFELDDGCGESCSTRASPKLTSTIEPPRMKGRSSSFENLELTPAEVPIAEKLIQWNLLDSKPRLRTKFVRSPFRRISINQGYIEFCTQSKDCISPKATGGFRDWFTANDKTRGRPLQFPWTKKKRGASGLSRGLVYTSNSFVELNGVRCFPKRDLSVNSAFQSASLRRRSLVTTPVVEDGIAYGPPVTIQMNLPLPEQETAYIEVELDGLEAKAEDTLVTVGLAPAGYPSNQIPGVLAGSTSFASDGTIFLGAPKPANVCDRMQVGDVIGMIIYKQAGIVMFKHNGEFVSEVEFTSLSAREPLHVTVGLVGEGSVEVNFGSKKFQHGNFEWGFGVDLGKLKELEAQLEAFYSVHNPVLLKRVDRDAKYYLGRDAELNTHLKEVYGEGLLSYEATIVTLARPA